MGGEGEKGEGGRGGEDGEWEGKEKQLGKV